MSESRLIYAAHPMTTYGTAREAGALDRLAELLPEAEIINPTVRYGDNAHWHRDWPNFLPRLAGLVVFGDSRGAIGTGCRHELVDAWWRGVPVAMLDSSGVCRAVAGFRVLPPEVRSCQRTGIPIAGAQKWLERSIRCHPI